MFSFTIREALLRTKLDLHVEFPFLPDFQLSGKRKIFKFSKNVPGISANFREITGNFQIPKILRNFLKTPGISENFQETRKIFLASRYSSDWRNSREIFPGIFLELDYFDIF